MTGDGWLVCACMCVCVCCDKGQRRTYYPCLILLRQGLEEPRARLAASKSQRASCLLPPESLGYSSVCAIPSFPM